MGAPIYSRPLLVLGLFAGLATASGCRAEPHQSMTTNRPVTSPESAYGYWRIDAIGGSRCHIALLREATSNGLAVNIENCEVSGFQAIKGWQEDEGGIILVAKDGARVIELHRVDADRYASTDGQYSMTRAPMT